MCRPSYPPLTRHSREACPRPRSGSGNPSRRAPVIPAKLVPGPDRGAGVHPAAHPSFPRNLSPAPIRERESIPPRTRHSREACPRPRSGSGNPYGLDVGLPLDKPKVHGKTGVVAKTKRPWLAGWARPAPATVRGAVGPDQTNPARAGSGLRAPAFSGATKPF